MKAPTEMSMDPDITTTVAQVGATALAAVIGGLLAAQRAIKVWTSTDAETSVVKLLREEVTRLAHQNSVMAESLNLMQQQIVQLNREKALLQGEVDRLQQQVNVLKDLGGDRG